PGGALQYSRAARLSVARHHALRRCSHPHRARAHAQLVPRPARRSRGLSAGARSHPWAAEWWTHPRRPRRQDRFADHGPHGRDAADSAPGPQLLNDSAGSDAAARDTLTFLAYREKLLAGSWRFDTYFGRDTLMAVRLLMPVLSAT